MPILQMFKFLVLSNHVKKHILVINEKSINYSLKILI